MKKIIRLTVLLGLFIPDFVGAGEGDLAFIVGRDVNKSEYDIYSANPLTLQFRKIIDCGLIPTWSPDRQKIAYFSIKAHDDKIHRYQLALGIANREGTKNWKPKFKNLRGFIHDLAWSPDGKEIAVAAGRWILIASLHEEIMAFEGPSRIEQVVWLSSANGIIFYAKEGIFLLNLKNREQTLVTPHGWLPKVVPGTDKLIYLKEPEGEGKNINMLMRDLKKGSEEVLLKNVFLPLPKKSVYCVSENGQKVVFYPGGLKVSEELAFYGVYDFSKKTVKYYRTDRGFMEAVSHDGTKIAGVFKFGDKAGYGVLDLVTGKKSLIREVREDEIGKNVFMFSKLIDW